MCLVWGLPALSLSALASEPNEDRNLYFGDTHVHTALSFDSYLFGNRVGLDGAYDFARGEPLKLPNGETIQLSAPLDFVVMTDHAETFGLFETCAREGLTQGQKDFCEQFETPSRETFNKLRKEGIIRPLKRLPDLCDPDMEACLEDARKTWDIVRAAADANNEPGKFTAFAGYEYSPSLPKQGKVHRNVIFRGSATPDRVVSSFDAATVLDLWQALEEECIGDCKFLTIPHNMNKMWGIGYSGKTIDGDPYKREDWEARRRNEPIAEIFQIKGSSECGYGVGASDEECNFELVVPICEGEQVPGCSGPNSFAREGLKKGLALEYQLGFNPLQFGFIGSTDTHSSAPGDTEEYDYQGATLSSRSPKGRLGIGPDEKKPARMNPETGRRNPGGLAAVWATENTRGAIFDAMRRRETFATSGTRIKLRFFAGWDFDDGLIRDAKIVSKASEGGVPMGGVLSDKGVKGSPEFLVWVMKDSNSANLQRVQIVKGWLENGKTKEQVRDIACSDGLTVNPTSGRCPDNGATVDVSDCSYSRDKGDQDIKVSWRDPDFNRDQSAFYYVRVLENPTCRWSRWDEISFGLESPLDLPDTVQERAWSSPIWYTP